MLYTFWEHLITIIRKASPCYMWQSTQRPSGAQMQKIKDSKVFSPKWNVHTIFFLTGLKDYPGRGMEKTIKARSRSVFQTKQRSCIQQITVLVIGCTNLFKWKSDKILVLSWEGKHKNPTASWRVIDALGICWNRWNLSCVVMWPLICHNTPANAPTLLGRPHFPDYMDNTSRTQWVEKENSDLVW